MTVHFGHFPEDDSARAAIPLYGKGEFESPTRSTIPLLSWLIHDRATLHQTIQKLGLPADCSPCLEYQVRPRRGQGQASHTDLMLRSTPAALAIEAKWTEPIGLTVREWLTKGEKPANRQAVLEGWLDYLRDRLKIPLNAADFHDTLYQMLHRAASAAATGESPHLAYFLFQLEGGPKTTPVAEIHRHLGHLWDKLGQPAHFPFALVEIALKPRDAYEKIRHLPKAKPATAEAIIAALQNRSSPLFDFEVVRIRQVQASS